MVKKLYIIAFLVLIVDRFFKLFLSRTKLNTGAAFNILEGWTNFLIVFGILVVLVILYYRNNKKLETGMGFLLGGVVSNLIDRVVYGGVIDYIFIESVGNVFNLGDVANVVGAILIGYYLWKE